MAIYIPLNTPETSPADRARAARQNRGAFPSKIAPRAWVPDSPQETFDAGFGYFFDGATGSAGACRCSRCQALPLHGATRQQTDGFEWQQLAGVTRRASPVRCSHCSGCTATFR